MQLICAVIFLAAYTIYAASSIKACGTLFYTFMGGFSAVCRAKSRTAPPCLSRWCAGFSRRP